MVSCTIVTSVTVGINFQGLPYTESERSLKDLEDYLGEEISAGSSDNHDEEDEQVDRKEEL